MTGERMTKVLQMFSQILESLNDYKSVLNSFY